MGAECHALANLKSGSRSSVELPFRKAQKGVAGQLRAGEEAGAGQWGAALSKEDNTTGG